MPLKNIQYKEYYDRTYYKVTKFQKKKKKQKPNN